MLFHEKLTQLLNLLLFVCLIQGAKCAVARGETPSEICKITFKTDPGEPPASCTASYIGNEYFLTDRHCFLAPQTETHVYNNNDLLVDPSTVELQCPDQTVKIDIIQAVTARDLDESEDSALDLGSKLEVRDLLIFKITHFHTLNSSIKLFISFADFPGFSSATSAWFTSYGMTSDEKFNLKLHSYLFPNLENFSVTAQTPLYGIISHEGTIFSPGDSGAPLTVDYNGNRRVVGLASGYCGVDTCGGGRDFYNLVTWTILKNRFQMVKDSALQNLFRRVAQ